MTCANESVSVEEVVLSLHHPMSWQRRQQELLRWVERPRQSRGPKKVQCLLGTHVDDELYETLVLLNAKGIVTEYSCAGVSVKDDVREHSLYAYINLYSSPLAEAFVQSAMSRLKGRLLVTYDPGKQRFDLSSFYIGHNRTFCKQLQACAEAF